MFLVLKFELILIIGSNNVLTEGARKVYRGRRVGQGWPIGLGDFKDPILPRQSATHSPRFSQDIIPLLLVLISLQAE
jgi:hypothetical protein